MNSKHAKTLKAIHTKPTLVSIVFSEIESFMRSLDFEIEEGNGSRMSFYSSQLGERLHLHRPHPGKEAKRYQVEAIREFLETCGFKP
jgi:HicA toxin of bacterial toxin-antitoxin,